MMTPSPRFEDSGSVCAPAGRHPIAVLPLGAHEQHGPHLPFETDTLIAEGIAGRLKMALPAGLPVTFLPAESVGYSIEHMDVEGTKTLAFEEAVNRWLGIAEGLAKRDIRKFVMLNAHGGNSPLISVVATEARVRFAMLAVATSWTRFGLPDGVIPLAEKAIGIHGGDIETSVMLALHPDKVDMAKAEDFPSRQTEFATRFKHLRAYGPHAFGWKMSDINEQGVAGNAAAATAEKGEALIAHAVKGLVELLEDVDAFDVSALS
ncbi:MULTISPECIES: creatininase family protein [Rhizobium]|uniref:creatininase family protein n=1 Tax=Rhizobium TaxID=379 RepID=UPI001B325E2F|nr:MULTISPECIES: creatininase family protein [Rhizobium]MBX4907633.1 creatininase family protein [Rhizobium bangladeshense]MBX5215396.1 creatininase family protein [Rhizobium sp. NLR9a]MBX5232562.1 creatininase family protein [Rhizobium sp. NLR4a]MBX5237992.1 creatininase family protein [Rhizobium sp. NLR22b]MBX5245194.1 creatininase family protein [Rhizobium sp. NLR3b]